MDKPAVSIIMPAYNSGKYISSAIESVRSQTYENWELLVCDDGSSDNTLDVARHWKSQDPRIRVLQYNTNHGAAYARRMCLKRSKGNYIAFLDSDDTWPKNKLTLQIAFMREFNVDFSFGDYLTIDESGNYIGHQKFPDYVNRRLLEISNFIPCLTVVLDRKLLKGVTSPIIRKRNDYALWLEIFSVNKNLIAKNFGALGGIYRKNTYGLSINKVSAVRFHYLVLRRFGKRGKLLSLFFVVTHSLVFFLRNYLPVVYLRLLKMLTLKN